MANDLPDGFRPFAEAFKAHIRDAQLRAALAVNRTLLALYWNIGRAIAVRQKAEGWGAKVIDQLADEVQRAFPGVGGFSRTNVYRMRAFYPAYPATAGAAATVPQPVGRFPEPRAVDVQPRRGAFRDGEVVPNARHIERRKTPESP